MNGIRKCRVIATAKIKIPYAECYVQAGFPSPADDYADLELDLSEYLIRHPEATFFIRVQGESMIGAGINSGDILLVDRAVKPEFGDIILAVIDGDFTVKRLVKEGERILLQAENPKYKAIEINPEMDFEVWGTVIYTIHKNK